MMSKVITKHLRNDMNIFGQKLFYRVILALVLHGPSMFVDKAKIYRVHYKQSSSLAFDETPSYWSVPKSS